MPEQVGSKNDTVYQKFVATGYCWLSQKTLSSTIMVVKNFGEAVLRPLVCCARGQLPPP